MKYAVTIDIGGTNTRVALIDATFKIQKRVVFPTNTYDPRENMSKIKEIIEGFDQKVVGIGVSCPGPLDLIHGVVLTPPNLKGWHHFELVKELNKLTGLHVTLENDANLACLAESTLGAGKGHKSVQFFTISTGLGAGFVLNGDIFQGTRGFAQEVANVIVLPKGPKVNDLQEGSLESVCSGTGIVERARKHGYEVEHAGEVYALSKQNDYHAMIIMDDAIEYMANAVASAYAFLDPDIVVLGGSVALKIEGYIEAIESRVKEKVYGVMKPHIKLRAAQLGDDSGLIGGGILAFNHQKEV